MVNYRHESSFEIAALTEEGFKYVGSRPGAKDCGYHNWLTIADQVASVKGDDSRFTNSILIPSLSPVRGCINDVAPSKLIEVEEITAIGGHNNLGSGGLEPLIWVTLSATNNVLQGHVVRAFLHLFSRSSHKDYFLNLLIAMLAGLSSILRCELFSK
jgi:hypothetical protein